MAISALVHTKNSEKTLKRALQSLNFADELVVVDMESTDDTLTIARECNARIYAHEDVGYVEPARNFGIEKCSHEWVLVVDADEEVPQALAEKLIELSKGKKIAWELPRKTFMFGLWIEHTNWWPDYNVRFFPKGNVRWPDTIHAQPKVEGTVKKLPAQEELALVHHHHETVAEFVERMNRYTSVAADSAYKKLSPDKVLRAFSEELLRRYYAQDGYKDGEVGAYLSVLQAMYQFVSALKIKEKQGFSKKDVGVEQWLEDFFTEFQYWMLTKKIKSSSNPLGRLYWRVKRKSIS